MSQKIVLSECLTRVSQKRCPIRGPHKGMPQKCQAKAEKSVKQECSARVAVNAIGHLLFIFLCFVGTLPLRPPRALLLIKCIGAPGLSFLYSNKTQQQNPTGMQTVLGVVSFNQHARRVSEISDVSALELIKERHTYLRS